MESKKNDANEFIYKRETFTDIENKLWVTKGERGWRKDKLGIEINRQPLL